MNTPNLLDHADFIFDNLSNYDIKQKEITGDSVVDVPVFPPQNIVVDDQTIPIYKKIGNSDHTDISFVYNGSIYTLLLMDHEQRIVFMKYDEWDRNLVYRYGGRVYPQAREEGAYSLTSKSLYVFGGKDLTIGRRELWRLDLAEMRWYPEHPIGTDADLQDFPAARWSSCFISYEGDHYLMGGQTFSEIGNVNIELNDLWWFSSASKIWNKLDAESYLPRDSESFIVYFDGAIVRVVADKQLWSCPKDGSTPSSKPFTDDLLKSINYTAVLNGKIHFMVGYDLYTWNNSTESFETVKESIDGIGIGLDNSLYRYITSQDIERRRGENSQYQPKTLINVKYIHHAVDETIYKICDIDAVPIGLYMATTDLPDGKKYLGLGIQDGVFIEDHYIWDGNSSNTKKIGSNNIFKPQERIAASCGYDKRNNRIWIFGGYSGSFYYNDLWYLDLTTEIWTRVSTRISETTNAEGKKVWPEARARSGICVVEGTLWIVSGYSDVRAYADMWKYDIATTVMSEEIQTDWVPFGTSYHVFEWRDRLWLFNGERGKLYRYFYEYSQWYPVLIYNSRALVQAADALKDLAYSIEQAFLSDSYNKSSSLVGSAKYTKWRVDQCNAASGGYNADLQAAINLLTYMLPPIRLSMQGNNLMISYLSRVETVIGGRNSIKETFICSIIDLDTKEHSSLPGAIGNAKFWRDQTCCMDNDGYMYFYNISSFEFAQRNQVPYFEYAYFPLLDECPLSRTNSTFSFFDPDIVGGMKERLAYIDSENMYIIYDDDVEFSPLMPTVQEMKEGIWNEYWPQKDFSVFGYWPSGDDTSAQDDAKATVGRGRYRIIPRFLWKRVPMALTMQIRNAQLTWFDKRTDRTYIVDGSTGQVRRFRAKDGTSMVYPSKIWRESACAQKGTMIYSFGGSLIGGSPLSNQIGIADSGYKIPCGECKCIFVPDSHNSFMMYDLSYVGLQMRLLQEHPELEPYDYDNIRDFLVNIAITNGIKTSSTEPNDLIDVISKTLYSSTVSIAGDLAVRHIRNENGTRPPHPRSGALSIQIDSNLYIGGGAWKYFMVHLDPKTCEITSCDVFYKINYDQDKNVIPHKYNDFYRFDLESRTWFRLADLPQPIYGGTVLVDKNNENMYIIGGFLSDDLQDPSNKIFVYNLNQDKWDELGPTPINYSGRGLPNCFWLDDYRMMIMFGFSAVIDTAIGKVTRIPKPDSWLVDIQTGIMYKLFESSSKTSSIVPELDEGDGLIDMIDFFYPLLAKFGQDTGLGMNLRSGMNAGLAGLLDSDSADVSNAVSTEDAMSTASANGLKWYKIDPSDGKIVGIRNVELPESGVEFFSPTNVKTMFRAWDGNPWMVLSTDFGPRIYRWYKKSNWEYRMDFLVLENPLLSHCEVVIWDGISKLIFMWNKFNIWELDLKAAIANPDGEIWRHLPPNPDLEDIGLVGNDVEIKTSRWNDNEIICYRADGGVYRYDQNGMIWRIDRLPRRKTGSKGEPFLPDAPSVTDIIKLLTTGKSPTPNTKTHKEWEYTTVARDGGELYYYTPGTTSGIYYNLLYKQADKFYFDAELLETVMSLPVYETLAEKTSVESMMSEMAGYQADFGKIVRNAEFKSEEPDPIGLDIKKMKAYLARNRSVIKRDRILTFNRNNHLMRAWVKKYGEFDVRFDFDSYFTVSRVDISVDYDTMVQADRFIVEILTDEGWIIDRGTAIAVDEGYDWDPFSRKYRKMMIMASGDYTYIETTRPGYFIRVILPSDSFVRAVRVKFSPKPEIWNYIARINHIFIMSEEGTLDLRDESGSLSIMFIEPFDTIESEVYKVYVKNTNLTDDVYDVRVFVNNNYRILLSKDLISWDNHAVGDPLSIIGVLHPGESIHFFMKAISYFDKSTMDLILTCDKALV